MQAATPVRTDPEFDPETEPGAMPPRRSALRRFAPLAALVAGGAAAWWAFGDYLSFEALRDNRAALLEWRDSNYAIAAASYMATYVAAVAFSLPGALALTLAGGFLFGLGAGGLMIVVAATLGATLIFLAARSSLGASLEARLSGSRGFVARLRREIARDEISYLLLMRLVPVVPFFVANLAPAFLGVSTRTYVLTTFFGIMPGTLVYTWVGSGLGEVFDRGGTPDLGILFEWQILGPLMGLCALAALPILVRSVRGARDV